MNTIAFFNNKGGVGKTTLVYHLAWMMTKLGKRVVVVDLDPQANLTAMFLSETRLEEIWAEETSSKATIMGALRPIIKGIGDIETAHVEPLTDTLALIPGELGLAQFEGDLSESWGKCLDGREPAFRTTSSFHRIIQAAGQRNQSDVALVDVGPNLGAINRAALIAADAIVVPLAPDLFSLQGLRNLGPTLERWRHEWETRVKSNPEPSLTLPRGTLSVLGYVVQQFGTRDNRPVKAYERWARKIPATYQRHVLRDGSTTPTDPDPHCLGMLKHYRSLMPLAMDAHKPVFDLKPADGAIGAHSYAAQESAKEFSALASAILNKA